MKVLTEYQACMDELKTLLQQYPQSRSFNEVHGFLTGVAVAGEYMEQAPWRQTLLGLDESAPLDVIAEDMFICLDDAVYYLEEELLEPGFQPLVSTETVQNTTLPKTDEWSKGFLASTRLIEQDWDLMLACSSQEMVRQMMMLTIIADPQQHASLMFSNQLDYGSAEFLIDIRHMAGPIATAMFLGVSVLPDDLDELREELDFVLAQHASEDVQTMSDTQLFDLLKTRNDTLSLQAVEECVRRQDTMAPKLCAYLNDDTHWEEDGEVGDWWALIHCVFILGKIPGAPAAAALLKAMDRQAADPDGEMWEWLDSYWPALLANKMEFAIGPLRQMAENAALPAPLRYDALECLLFHAFEDDPQQLENTIDLVAKIVRSIPTADDSRYLCANLLLDFPRSRHRELLNGLAREQHITGENYFSANDVKQAFTRGDYPEWIRFSNPWWFYQPGQIARRQLQWREDDAMLQGLDDDDELDFATDDLDEFDEDVFDQDFFDGDDYGKPMFAQPLVREAPKVGRNDPCPCGSGKKYKKCCLH